VRFAQRPAWRVLSPIDEVKRCFDKNACATLLESLDVSITEGVPAPSTHAGCRTLMAQRGWRSSFLKLSCGSSASCLALLRGTPERPVVFTMLKRDNGRWFNSLTIQRLDNPNVIEEVPRFLFGEGSRLEREHSKAPHDGRYVDLRVLCIAGEPRFFVLRQSTHPITNLHLGGGRGEPASFRPHISEEAWAVMESTCRTVASAGRSFHLALDVLFEPDLITHRVIELNAFGDLLPNLRVAGESVYEAQLSQIKPWQ
jgi:hypothetical protein